MKTMAAGKTEQPLCMISEGMHQNLNINGKRTSSIYMQVTKYNTFSRNKSYTICIYLLCCLVNGNNVIL